MFAIPRRVKSMAFKQKGLNIGSDRFDIPRRVKSMAFKQRGLNIGSEMFAIPRRVKSRANGVDACFSSAAPPAWLVYKN